MCGQKLTWSPPQISHIRWFPLRQQLWTSCPHQTAVPAARLHWMFSLWRRELLMRQNKKSSKCFQFEKKRIWKPLLSTPHFTKCSPVDKIAKVVEKLLVDLHDEIEPVKHIVLLNQSKFIQNWNQWMQAYHAWHSNTPSDLSSYTYPKLSVCVTNCISSCVV